MKRSYSCLPALLILLLAACAMPARPGALPATPTVDFALFPDTQQYAQAFNVSPQEAARRMQIQQWLGESNLEARLTSEQAATFGGLWIQHEPEYKIVVAFTRDGEQTLAPYIEGQPYAPDVEVRTVRYTHAELRAFQDQFTNTVTQLGITVSSATDVINNRVTVYVANAAELTRDLAAAGVELPAAVEIKENGGPGASNRPRLDTLTMPDGKRIYFPKQGGNGPYMAALAEGILVEENGCLRLDSLSGPTRLIVWPGEQTLRLGADGVLEVVNKDGAVGGRVGEPIRMGGGQGALPEGLTLPDCPGPYWIGGPDAEIPPSTAATSALVNVEPPLYLLNQGLAAYNWRLPVTTVEGKVALNGLCLRLQADEDDYLLIFPPNSAISSDASVPYAVQTITRQGETRLLATPGQTAQLSGTAVTETTQPEVFRALKEALPAGCSGPYWVVREASPAVAVADTVEPDSSWLLYADPRFEITLRYPPSWSAPPDPGQSVIRHGDDGFFQLTAAGVAGPTAESVCREILKPEAIAKDTGQFGSAPVMEMRTVAGEPACLIMPSEDQRPYERGLDMAVLIVEYPEAMRPHSQLHLWANPARILQIGSALQFVPGATPVTPTP